MGTTKYIPLAILLSLLLSIPSLSFSSALKEREKIVLDQFKSEIPIDKIKSVDELYVTWKEVQSGKSKAIIIDIRTEAEFDAGHIIGSSNIDSGHAYGIPKKIKNPNEEIWIFCRTQHRASYFAGMLYKYGYTNVNFVKGGIKEWSEKGYPLGNKYLGEIVVAKYQKVLKEDYWYRENK